MEKRLLFDDEVVKQELSIKLNLQCDFGDTACSDRFYGSFPMGWSAKVMISTLIIGNHSPFPSFRALIVYNCSGRSRHRGEEKAMVVVLDMLLRPPLLASP